MTDFEKKLAKVKTDDTIEDFEVYETTNDELVILIYNSYLCITEYVYSKNGKFIEEHTSTAY